MKELTISVVAQQIGIRPSALRYYESIGLLPLARRVNGHRRYEPSIIPLVKVIQLAQQAGFTVAEIQILLHGFAPNTSAADRWRPLATQKLQEINELISPCAADEGLAGNPAPLWLPAPRRLYPKR